MARDDIHDRETVTGATGAPQKPKGEPEAQREGHRAARGGGIDLGDVARGVAGGGYPPDTDDDTGADATDSGHG